MALDLTAELRKQVTMCEADLRERSADLADPWAVALRGEYDAAFAAGRTGLSWSQWRDGELAQGAVAWVLGAVFVRFCEDNALVDRFGSTRRWIAGRGEGLRLAVDAESAFYAADPRRGTSDWLRVAFTALAELPGTSAIFGAQALVWSVPLGDDACREILKFWRETGPDGQPLRSLASPELDTRFLGDLYQDLSELAKKKYALLQTPTFVESFILDRTLTPALAEFGLPGLRMIDPTCGSGHFLLGAFDRLFAAWQEREPAAPAGENLRRALDSIHGVDINPFAVAIARFRVLVAALRAGGYTRLADAPDYELNLAVGDSLLGGVAQGMLFDDSGAATFHREEDIIEHPGILDAGRYHVVVGNPPYITVKDKALNEAYRKAYSTCHRQYALSVPFMQLFFELAIRGESDQPAGFVGQITSNSFMKREFGSKVIESLLSGLEGANPVDLLDVIDTSGAFIPGHGTPTVILVGRRRRPAGGTVRAVLGVRGEPGQPDDPAKGLVWTEIVEHVDAAGFDGTFVTVTDLDRAVLKTHPWSLSGGGASDVKAAIDHAGAGLLAQTVKEIGFGGVTREDSAYVIGVDTCRRAGIDRTHRLPLVEGEFLRDFGLSDDVLTGIWPYDAATLEADAPTAVVHSLWPYKRILSERVAYGSTQLQRGLTWFEYSMFFGDRFRSPLSIAFAEVATHNHFVLDRGGKVFKQTAPVIKLPAGAGEDDHWGLLGLLSSSAACFWLKQVSHNKGEGGGARVDAGYAARGEPWRDTYAFTGTRLQEFPLPVVMPLEWGRQLDSLAQQLSASSSSAVCAAGTPTRAALDAAHAEYLRIRAEMIAAQEELDWQVYRLYGLIPPVPELVEGPGLRQAQPPVMTRPKVGIALGERPFEIVLARRVEAGEEESTWFSHPAHRYCAVTEIPAQWPADYRATVQRRLDEIASNPAIRLLERPEFKRRWASEPWQVMETRAVSNWVLDRLEDPALWSDHSGPRVQSTAQLASAVRHDAD